MTVSELDDRLIENFQAEQHRKKLENISRAPETYEIANSLIYIFVILERKEEIRQKNI